MFIYASAYAVNAYFFYEAHFTGIVPRILGALLGLAIIATIFYALNRKARARSLLRLLGFRKEGMLRSFLWANAFLLPLMVILIRIVLVSGPESLLANAPVTFPSSPIPPWYPFFASTAWILGGLTAFPFLQAYPYEEMAGLPKRFVVPLVAILWVGLYNAPLVTGAVIWDDIVFFGFLFTTAYHKSRNSIGLVAAYVLAELPVWVLFAGTWGVAVFTDGLIVRTLIGILSVGVLAFWHLRERRAHSLA